MMNEDEELQAVADAERADWHYGELEAKFEAQAEELEQANNIRDDAISVLAMVAEGLGVDQEPHQTFNERLIEAAEKDWYKAYMESSWELAQARARIARLQKIIEGLRLALGGEPDEPQSFAAALQAKSLRDAADDWEPQPCPLTRPAIREQLRLRADRIEREAKESGS